MEGMVQDSTDQIFEEKDNFIGNIVPIFAEYIHKDLIRVIAILPIYYVKSFSTFLPNFSLKEGI